MAMVINTNMGSLNAVRTLDLTSRELSTSMERLTSGLRINSAADDAAGLAITTSMTSQIRGTDQAIKNVSDGISLVQTMDGASEEVVNALQRMRELAVQSLNGTYGDANRAQMDSEFSQLEEEINRIAHTTKFNQINLMGNVSVSGPLVSGTPTPVDVHVGWQAGSANKITVSTASFRIAASGASGILGRYTNITGSVVSASFSANTLTTQAGASVAIQHIDGALSLVGNQRAAWGALQNRLESTMSNLQNMNENMNGARSAILDADFAKESAELARTQVLQQAGMSMLAQANQSTQNVMQLLQ
ncbi:flagellin [Thiomicrorhabdus sediminis]|uniref:Flagellin n=1 Tax=Thiomicrorhabdus sediminis TaxID=2580412 RepID=A0A4P9K7W6_9GAMM|nr:flagellin [Thiomicrorhabdus sediminis]QCU90465.1 flagellin FliC [Thiomicrorhabdus sediminis]QCU90466.1 flagellin FliC [Thiomicrorhabdus sediminis]